MNKQECIDAFSALKDGSSKKFLKELADKYYIRWSPMPKIIEHKLSGKEKSEKFFLFELDQKEYIESKTCKSIELFWLEIEKSRWIKTGSLRVMKDGIQFIGVPKKPLYHIEEHLSYFDDIIMLEGSEKVKDLEFTSGGYKYLLGFNWYYQKELVDKNPRFIKEEYYAEKPKRVKRTEEEKLISMYPSFKNLLP